MTRLSIAIPVYRATNTLEKLVDLCFEHLNDQIADIILVYDCGRAESWKTIQSLSDKYPRVKGVHLSRNYGQHNATICGFEYASGDLILTMDEDLQHHPAEVPAMIRIMEENDFDLVYGKYREKKHSGFRNWTSTLLNKMLLKGIPDLNPHYTSFRLIKSPIARKTIDMRNSYTFLDGYLTWLTTNTGSIEIEHRESEAGRSSYSIKKLIEHSINIFVTFSNLPIRLLTYFSIAFFLLSTIYSIVIVIRKFLDVNYLAGFPTLIVLIGFGFSFTLLGLGIIGEYIQRINLKTTRAPNYSVRKVIHKEKNA